MNIELNSLPMQTQQLLQMTQKEYSTLKKFKYVILTRKIDIATREYLATLLIAEFDVNAGVVNSNDLIVQLRRTA